MYNFIDIESALNTKGEDYEKIFKKDVGSNDSFYDLFRSCKHSNS